MQKNKQGGHAEAEAAHFTVTCWKGTEPVRPPTRVGGMAVKEVR